MVIQQYGGINIIGKEPRQNRLDMVIRKSVGIAIIGKKPRQN
jgi:hypothetical protein